MSAIARLAVVCISFADDENGGSSIEFALVVALIAMVLVSTLDAMGSNILITFNSVLTKVMSVNT